ncbi:hypothetical protein V9L05_00395 [Bernardetia sp. Wsw4-3y2]|uniref:hypothetical protein n=1 Tax=unclassified Bernardetia TaxID=2647129 RepID=UPI0030CD540B
MKQLFKISFVLLYLFLLNGNGFLYAHTNQANEKTSLEKFFSTIENTSESLDADFDNQYVIPILEADSFPSGKKKSKRFKFRFFEKEEKEKEDKLHSLEISSQGSFTFASIFNTPLFARFYNYNRNYLYVSENLNYFLFHKCYILFQVFRL